MRFNDSKGKYPVIQLDDHFCLFTACSIHSSEIPAGLYRYELSATDQTADCPICIHQTAPDSQRIGSILAREELPLDAAGNFQPKEYTVLALDGQFPTVEEFRRLSVEDLSRDPGGGFLYQSSFGLIPVYPHIDMYCSTNNLYLGLYYYDEEEQYLDHFGDVTVNVNSLPYLYSTIDTNNNGSKILDFLERNQFGTRTDCEVSSGFCQFPIFRFNEDAIRKVDPDLFPAYAKAHSRLPERLEDKLKDATERASPAQPAREDQAHTI